jgi:hypothetical protein
MTKRLVKANGRTVCRAAVLGAALVLGLLLGGCENPTSGGDDSPSAQELAEEFRAAHGEILELLTARAALSDEAAIDAALEAYEALSDEVKAELTAEKAKLDGLKARMTTRTVSTVGLRSYLEGLPANTVYNPYALAYTGQESPAAIYNAIGAAGKYVALDLSKSGVTGFGYDLEEGRKLVVELTLPDSLTEIEAHTESTPPFGGFANLKSLRAPGLVTVGNYEFYQCPSLETVTLDVAASIGDSAFYQCTGLTTATLNKAAEIGRLAFYGCTGLKTVTLDKAVTIGGTAFGSCTSLGTVNLNVAVSIGDYAFNNCTNLSLEPATLNGATEIGGYAFYSCKALNGALSLPEAVSIGTYAFRNCDGLTAVSLPKVASIEERAFENCSKITTVNLPVATTIGASAFQGCTLTTVVTLPKVETLGNGAFQRCTSLTTVTLGETPPTIGTRIFQGAATTSNKTITIRVPNVSVYTAAGSPWTDKVNKTNSTAGEYWDNLAATKANLTVALEAIGG